MSELSNDHPYSDAAWRAREAELRRSLAAEGIAPAVIVERTRLEREKWQIIQDRYENVARWKMERDPLWVAVFTILTTHDLMGIAFPEIPDEYELEANTVTMRLSDAHSVYDVRAILGQEFLRLFNVDVNRSPEPLDALARDIWDALDKYRASPPSQ